ncbi:MAG TPA: ATPase, T2SS/T4P/T4SS family, partial [Acidobacteriota bacterium]|nr:ATPase, T2SS/T4P/T4SS family [Acidobacteriota bacterium]
MVSPTKNRRLLGEVLVETGLIDKDQLKEALKAQKESGGRLGFNLVRLGYLSAEKLTTFFQEFLGVGVVSEPLAERQRASDVIPRHLALYYKIAPIKIEGNVLTIAIAAIDHANLIQALEEITGYKIDPLIYPESEIRTLLDSSYQIPSDRGVELLSFSDNVFTVVDATKKIRPLASAQLKNEKDVGEWLRSIVAEAIREKSREILIKPEADNATISFRKDTFVPTELTIPSSLHDHLTFLLFRLARLNPLQQQQPQHGRFLVKINERKILMVVSAYPTIYGIRFMLEMFDEKLLRHSFEDMMRPYPELKMLLEDFVLRARKGMIVITGPEGAGRTSLLYSFLSRCKEEFNQIITLENSVRYPISGISQTQVNDKDMELALDNVLKQRPDLVAVHSIRSVRAAELSFLLTARIPLVVVMNSYDSYVALEWFCRHNLKSAIKAGLVHAVISPRLIPRICPNCAVPFQLSPDQTRDLAVPPGSQLKMNQGCDFCRNPDNHLADVILEFIRPDFEVAAWMEEDLRASSLRQQARKAGRKTLFDIAVQNAFRGGLDMQSVLKLQSV